MCKAGSIAGLLLSEGLVLQEQGWALLSSLPGLSMSEIQGAMSTLLWARIGPLQERARLRTLERASCVAFVHRYVALRDVCGALSLPWSRVWVRVDGGMAARSWADQSTTIIALQRGCYRIGRGRARSARGGYTRVALPEGHSLRGSERFGRRWSGGIALSDAEIASRAHKHPAH